MCHAAEYSPFYGIEKGAVLQEARIFHDPNLDPRRCSQVGLQRSGRARRGARLRLVGAAQQHAMAVGQSWSIRAPAQATTARLRGGYMCLGVLAVGAPDRGRAVARTQHADCPASTPMQVITKLLYLLTQGETFTKVRGGGVLRRLGVHPVRAQTRRHHVQEDSTAHTTSRARCQAPLVVVEPRAAVSSHRRRRRARCSLLPPSCSSPKTATCGAWCSC